MIDVLLINSPIIGETHDPDSGNSVPPLGLGYIHTQLIHSGYKCQFVDAVADSLLREEVLNKINESDARNIGLNVFSSNCHIIQYLVENVESPRNFFIGGPAARPLVPEIETWNPNGNLTIVLGEAELILPELIRNPNLAEQRKDKISVAEVAPGSRFFPHNIDLPLDRSIFKNEPIIRTELGLIEAHILASRGCMYNCAFCTAAKSVNPNMIVRYRTYGSLKEEIENLRSVHPEVNCIRILDDLFLRDQNSVELAVNLFAELGLAWRSMAHILTFRNLSSDWLTRVKKSGCRELFVGIESGNDKTLKHIRKPFDSKTAYETVTRILDAGIAVKCYFILGFPGETESELKDTFNLTSRLQKYANTSGIELRISPFQFRPYHGTSLYAELVSNGVTIGQIKNRADLTQTKTIKPYDCISGVYSEYSQDTINKYLNQMGNLSPIS